MFTHIYVLYRRSECNEKNRFMMPMIQNTEELKGILRSIQFALRETPGKPAEFLPDSKAAEALSILLQSHMDILKHSVITESRRRKRKHITQGEITSAVYLYATQPPIVKNIERSSRKGTLRIQILLDWIHETQATLESFEKRFKKWANIFATEYFNLCQHQSIDIPAMHWTEKDKHVFIDDKEVLDSKINSISIPTPDVDDNSINEDIQSKTRLFHKQIEYTLTFIRERFNGNDKRRRAIAVFVLLRYLTLEQFPGFESVNELLLECCAEWTIRSRTEIQTLLEAECSPLRLRTDLAKRRMSKDLPKLDYSFILSLIGEEPQHKGRYYTAVTRIDTELCAGRRTLFPNSSTNKE